MERLSFSSFSKADFFKWPKWHSASHINRWGHPYSDSYHAHEQNDTTLGGGGGGCRTSVPSPWTTTDQNQTQIVLLLWGYICFAVNTYTKAPKHAQN